MRLNQYLAAASGLSRRAADQAIANGRVTVDGQPGQLGQQVTDQSVTLDGHILQIPAARSIILHKPVGYITSRRQQGTSPTIYQLLPAELHGLKPVGRLDKDSSGLLLLTNDGQLAQRLSHPSHRKLKRYRVSLDKPLALAAAEQLRSGVSLADGPSRLVLHGRGRHWQVDLHEGRNRQIRRSFQVLGYKVVSLHRYQFGSLALHDLQPGHWQDIQL